MTYNKKDSFPKETFMILGITDRPTEQVSYWSAKSLPKKHSISGDSQEIKYFPEKFLCSLSLIDRPTDHMSCIVILDAYCFSEYYNNSVVCLK